jgi:hypothetical protein
MPKANVDLAQQSIDAMNQRDLDAFLALMDEDVEAVSRIVAVEGGMHGHDGIRRWWDSWFAVFPDYKVEIVETRDHGELVLGALRALGHGAGSDLPFEDIVWNASRWQRGKCVWWQIFNTEKEALEASGFSK